MYVYICICTSHVTWSCVVIISHLLYSLLFCWERAHIYLLVSCICMYVCMYVYMMHVDGVESPKASQMIDRKQRKREAREERNSYDVSTQGTLRAGGFE